MAIVVTFSAEEEAVCLSLTEGSLEEGEAFIFQQERRALWLRQQLNFLEIP
jgi:hypothetical protein